MNFVQIYAIGLRPIGALHFVFWRWLKRLCAIPSAELANQNHSNTWAQMFGHGGLLKSIVWSI
jgi:hypothetical protein